MNHFPDLAILKPQFRDRLDSAPLSDLDIHSVPVLSFSATAASKMQKWKVEVSAMFEGEHCLSSEKDPDMPSTYHLEHGSSYSVEVHLCKTAKYADVDTPFDRRSANMAVFYATARAISRLQGELDRRKVIRNQVAVWTDGLMLRTPATVLTPGQLYRVIVRKLPLMES